MQLPTIAVLLIQTFSYLFYVIYFLITLRLILSWFRINPFNKAYRFLIDITEPILAPARNLFMKSPLGGPGMVIDFSPIIAIFVLRFIESAIKYIILFIFSR